MRQDFLYIIKQNTMKTWGKMQAYLDVQLCLISTLYGGPICFTLGKEQLLLMGLVNGDSVCYIPWSVYKMFVKARCKSEVTLFRVTVETYCSVLICGVHVCLTPLVVSRVDATSK